MNRVRVLSLLLGIFFLVAQLGRAVPLVYADEYDEVTRELEDLREKLDFQQKQTEQKANTLEDLRAELEEIKNEVSSLEVEIAKKEREIKKRENDIRTNKGQLDKRLYSHYKDLRKNNNALVHLFATDDLSRSLQHFFYQKSMIDENKRMILRTALLIHQIQEEQKDIETEKDRLVPIKEEIDEQSEILVLEVKQSKEDERNLEEQIAELSEKQQSILSARSGSNTAPPRVGDVPTTGDPASTIGFKSQAPAGSFAAFSFGAHTHRNGMSQYGAKARAEQGQTAEDILAAYFPGATLNKAAGVPSTIDVQGYGTLGFSDYLYGIYEMPESWPLEALKAQAVLARTYAMGASKPICTTEACQVYGGAPKTGAWKQAVDETATWVLENTPTSQYSSTTGGFTNTAGWDTTDGTNNGDWTSRAYESIAQSPWFYRAWYRKGYRDDANSCGRAHPWLSQEEFADIINAWIVRKNPQGADVNRIIPTTIHQCPVGEGGGDPYSLEDLRNEADKSGGAVTSVSSVSVSLSNEGQTTDIRANTNRGEVMIPGHEFKETFNIRAPGYISIPQFGYAFFNIESN